MARGQQVTTHWWSELKISLQQYVPYDPRDKLLLDWASVGGWLWVSRCCPPSPRSSMWIPPPIGTALVSSLPPTCSVRCPDPLRIQLTLATSKKSDCTCTFNLYERGAEGTLSHFRFSTVMEKLYGRCCHFTRLYSFYSWTPTPRAGTLLRSGWDATVAYFKALIQHLTLRQNTSFERRTQNKARLSEPRTQQRHAHDNGCFY